MTAFRRVFAAALAVHGAIHLIGVVVAWEIAEFDDFPYSTEVIGGLDIGTDGMRILGALWLAATVALLVSSVGVLRAARWARGAILGAAAFSSLLCLIQVDTAWRGLAVDIVLMLGVTAWWYARVHEPHHRGLVR